MNATTLRQLLQADGASVCGILSERILVFLVDFLDAPPVAFAWDVANSVLIFDETRWLALCELNRTRPVFFR